MFTTNTGPGALVLDSSEIRQAGMIVFGYRLVAGRHIVRQGAVFQPSPYHYSKSGRHIRIPSAAW